jgi:hypothetical protein
LPSNGHRLPKVDDAATADRRHDIGAVLARGSDAGPRQLHRGLGGHREQRGRQSQLRQQPAVARRVRARAHQHPRPQARDHPGQLHRPATAGQDLARGGELERRRGHGR